MHNLRDSFVDTIVDGDITSTQDIEDMLNTLNLDANDILKGRDLRIVKDRLAVAGIITEHITLLDVNLGFLNDCITAGKSGRGVVDEFISTIERDRPILVILQEVMDSAAKRIHKRLEKCGYVMLQTACAAKSKYANALVVYFLKPFVQFEKLQDKYEAREQLQLKSVDRVSYHGSLQFFDGTKFSVVNAHSPQSIKERTIIYGVIKRLVQIDQLEGRLVIVGTDANSTISGDAKDSKNELNSIYLDALGKNDFKTRTTMFEDRKGAIDYLMCFGSSVGNGEKLDKTFVFRTVRIDTNARYVGPTAPGAGPEKYVNHYPLIAKLGA